MKRLVTTLAAMALALMMQFASCMPAAAASEQSMKCCASMPCTPANHNHGCCKKMDSGEAPVTIVAQSVSLQAPSLGVFDYPASVAFLHPSFEFAPMTGAQQHSPPKLYTLHASLLI